ncbi:NAD(P)-dependent oxidoreductase [uncultured Alsobacter sp.]|uniref:NAD(P)-dependent oxidoreductase n=1 Tax=uncultured Alsobacter sp. TaxID=1748258 RepID=UPI0025D21016|nr:NAD(P)-dependent oxidoreductase [uncultured Alsobacter sp.]
MIILLTHVPEARIQYYGERALAGLRALAPVMLHEGPQPLDPDGLAAAAAAASVIVADRATAVPATVFERLPQLQAVVRVAVDIRNIDVAAAGRAGVLVTRARPGFMAAVSELALGLMVDLSRGVSAATAAYRADRAPEVRMGRQLSGATAGLIGYGSIARHLAPILLAIGMRVVVADPYASVDDPRLTAMPLDQLLGEADYVICLAVATAETENLIDAAALGRMRPHAVFVNLSRGNLVDEAALEGALAAGRIAGAAMDVGRAPDQMPSPHLARLPGVIATPHIGGLTPQAVEAQSLETVEQVRAILSGAVPTGGVNGETWSRRPRPGPPA